MKNTGYTLVELLIGITISAILTTIGISAYRKAQDRQAVRVDGEKIEQTLREAQKKTSIGEKDCVGEFVSRRVIITLGESQITSQAFCKSDQGAIQTTTLQNTTFTSSSTIEFRSLNAAINITNPAGPTTDITFQSTTSSLQHGITITEPGTIEYKGEI